MTNYELTNPELTPRTRPLEQATARTRRPVRTIRSSTLGSYDSLDIRYALGLAV